MNKDINVQFVCRNCEKYNACEYYHGRKKDSYICKNFHLPKALEQEPEWIPVSERLPDDRKKCLVTFKGGYVGIMCYASNLYGVDEYDFCDEKGMAGWFDYDRELGHYSRDDVIAWLPLPTPYKAESEVDT